MGGDVDDDLRSETAELRLGGERRRNVNAALNLATTVALVVISIVLLRAADTLERDYR